MFSKTLSLAVLLAATVVSATQPTGIRGNPKSILDLVRANGTLSFLNELIQYAQLENTLSGKGPFTLFAPNNDAFGMLNGYRTDFLTNPYHQQYLGNFLSYHLVSGEVNESELMRMSQNLNFLNKTYMLKTIEGKNVTITNPNQYKDPYPNRLVINSDSEIVDGDNYASNGVIHIIDRVLDFTSRAPFYPDRQLWFRAFSQPDGERCGEVNVAPFIPDTLFDPVNAAALKTYEAITLALYKKNVKRVYGLSKPELGRCKDKNYNVSTDDIIYVDTFAPKQMMQEICKAICKCNYPDCPYVIDDPSVDTWCSLCSPKDNGAYAVTLNRCGLAHGQCEGPDPKTLVADGAQVLKDLLLKRLS